MIGRAERIVNYAVLTILAIIVLTPVATFVAAALSPDRSGQPQGELAWENFVTAWTQAGFGQAMSVTLTIAVLAVAGQVVLGVLAGFGFGVLGVPGNRFLFPLVLLGLMISTEAIIVPLYYQLRDWGLTNNIFGVVLIHIGMGVPFAAFWMRAAFRTQPKSLFEAMELDGAGALRTLWYLGIPLARPAIVTLMLLGFMWTWNDYFISLVFLHGENVTATVALGVFQGRFVTQFNLMAAGGLIVAAPVLILYVIFQRRFIAGMLAGAVRD
ncbi:carbohydrate ABC transporter permease [Homoserinibacter sp. GY 40078]|uniref:carbohydrate ABC transporter permease n=1 Tax=Homoserinibacter sp. GY 40078 TaxID=2603275 RepID=UPI0011C973DA|nr:carbohydrate ABC transporter permease [Homoserinibacter sp. GY 40078]TXK18906.1 carbohydrate ABC transporter permease [Homoserinibacter sp. GY 40078]